MKDENQTCVLFFVSIVVVSSLPQWSPARSPTFQDYGIEQDRRLPLHDRIDAIKATAVVDTSTACSLRLKPLLFESMLDREAFSRTSWKPRLTFLLGEGARSRGVRAYEEPAGSYEVGLHRGSNGVRLRWRFGPPRTLLTAAVGWRYWNAVANKGFNSVMLLKMRSIIRGSENGYGSPTISCPGLCTPFFAVCVRSQTGRSERGQGGCDGEQGVGEAVRHQGDESLPVTPVAPFAVTILFCL